MMNLGPAWVTQYVLFVHTQKEASRPADVIQLVEGMSSTHEALGLVPSAT